MSHQPTFTFPGNQPLIGIPFEESGQEVVRYFSEETQANKAALVETTQTALYVRFKTKRTSSLCKS